jgi:hypothetical protein
MTFTTTDKTIKTIRKDDPDYIIDNGIIMSPRAGFEISNDCPKQYISMVTEAIKNGWLKPIAYMKESEYVWEKLGE